MKIYDKEKTLCDCIRYRNKIGQDIVKESLHAYMRRHDKNVGKLIKDAEQFRIKSVLNRYLEVL